MFFVLPQTLEAKAGREHYLKERLYMLSKLVRDSSVYFPELTLVENFGLSGRIICFITQLSTKTELLLYLSRHYRVHGSRTKSNKKGTIRLLPGLKKFVSPLWQAKFG